MYKIRDNNLNIKDMKKLVLTIGLLVATSLTTVAQKEFINNDKIINYILQGKYQKIKELTQLPNFGSTVVMDNSMITDAVYDSKNSTNTERDSVLMHYITKFHKIGISKFAYNTKQSDTITCKVTKYIATDSNWVDPHWPAGTTIQHYNICEYTIIKNNIKYTAMVSVLNNKFISIGFFIF